jgi:hypothetical protein
MTIQQQNHFFDLAKKLDYDRNMLKERAKEKTGKKHFLDITTEEISPLIKILEEELRATQLEKPVEDFPNDYRIWDKKEHKMLYGVTAVVAMEFSNFEGDENRLKERYHIMQYTGRKDESGTKLYDFDIIQTYLGKKWLIQWSWKDCAWVSVNTETNESIYLSSLGKIEKIGGVYEDVKE